MKVTWSWLREFVDIAVSPAEVGALLSLRGFPLESLSTQESDVALDFEVTANRPDCLSVRGIAREIAVTYRLPLREPASVPAGADGPRAAVAAGDTGVSAPEAFADVAVDIDDEDLCARYVAAVAAVRVAPSPAWMQRRLLACGVRPISNIVDITNYVLLELGYPMHAFDATRLAGDRVVVRQARAAETLRTLDGRDRTLTADMLVVADVERAHAIAGVMGGADSEVQTETTRVVFEAAWFDPASVRATSKALGLRTEASQRFERGVDRTAAAVAMRRALHLLQLTGAGAPLSAIVDNYPRAAAAETVSLRTSLMRRVLGMAVPEARAADILQRLGCATETGEGADTHAGGEAGGGSAAAVGPEWRVRVPSWRVDLRRPIDLVEEIGRHHGFEHLPATYPAATQAPHDSDPRIARDAAVRDALVALGCSEAVTFAFIEDAAAAPFLGDAAPVTLANPLSEKFSTLRPSLLPGLLDAVSHNRRHGRRDVRLFEIGTRFSPQGEARAVAALWTGAAAAEHWSGAPREVDFFDVKGVAEAIAAALGASVNTVASESTLLIPGRAATVLAADRPVGLVGQLLPAVLQVRDLPAADAVYAVELDLDALAAAQGSGIPQRARALSRHPAVLRDLAILIDDTLSAAVVRGTIRAAAPTTLIGVREFDRYQGKNIPEGKVSLALRLTFQAPDRTLTDSEVSAAMDRIVGALQHSHAAIQR